MRKRTLEKYRKLLMALLRDELASVGTVELVGTPEQLEKEWRSSLPE